MSVHVALVVSTLRRSGPVNVIRSIVAAASRRALITIVGLSPDPRDSLREEIVGLGASYVCLGVSRATWQFYGPQRLGRLLLERNVDILHTHGIRADWLNAFGASGQARVSTVHTSFCRDYRFRYRVVVGATLAKLHALALRRIPRTVAVSDFVRDEIAGLGIQSCTIRNGVDTTVFRPALAEEKRAARLHLGLPVDAHISVVVGHLTPLKNPAFVIQAFQQASIPNSALLLLGDGPEMQRCRAAARPTAHIHFLGRRNDVREVLAACDLLISASHLEGFPMAILEAMAMNIRCLLADIPAHAELKRLSPDRIELYERGSIDQLVNRLNSAPKQSLTASHDLIWDISQERMASQYLSLYEKMMDRRGKSVQCVPYESSAR